MSQAPVATAPRSTAAESLARAAFNLFLNAAARSGALSAEHVRAGQRQPQTESFVRKALAAVRRLAPAVSLSAQHREQAPSDALSGPAAVAAAAQATLRSSPELARYLEEPRNSQQPSAPSLSDADLHALLSAYAFHETSGDGASSALHTGAVSIAICAGDDELPEKVAGAADSVFVQSICDVYALSLRAAHDGNAAALRALSEVRSIRRAGGDYGQMSTAPLSHDTDHALQVLRIQLLAGEKFWLKTKSQLRENARWVASEGLAHWMQSNGMDFSSASNLSARASALCAFATRPAPANTPERRGPAMRV